MIAVVGALIRAGGFRVFGSCDALRRATRTATSYGAVAVVVIAIDPIVAIVRATVAADSVGVLESLDAGIFVATFTVASGCTFAVIIVAVDIGITVVVGVIGAECFSVLDTDSDGRIAATVPIITVYVAVAIVVLVVGAKLVSIL